MGTLLQQSKFSGAEEITRDSLLPDVNMGMPTDELFGASEADEILTAMASENMIMYDAGVVVSLFPLLPVGMTDAGLQYTI